MPLNRRIALIAAPLALTLTRIARADDSADVTQALEAFRQAMLKNEPAGYDRLLSPDVSYSHSSGKVETKAEVLADVASGRNRWQSIDLSDVSIRAVGNNAITRFVFTAKVENQGKVNDVKIGMVLVWVKQAGNWQILLRQGFKI